MSKPATKHSTCEWLLCSSADNRVLSTLRDVQTFSVSRTPARDAFQRCVEAAGPTPPQGANRQKKRHKPNYKSQACGGLKSGPGLGASLRQNGYGHHLNPYGRPLPSLREARSKNKYLNTTRRPDLFCVKDSGARCLPKVRRSCWAYTTTRRQQTTNSPKEGTLAQRPSF